MWAWLRRQQGAGGSGDFRKSLAAERKRLLFCGGSPAAGLADGRKGIAVERRRSVEAECFEVLLSGVPLVLGQAVLGIDGVPLGHAGVAVGLGQNRGSRDGDGAGIAPDERFLLDEHIELYGIEKEIVRLNRELLKRSGHSLARGLVDVPGVDALRIDFSNGIGQSMFADPRGEFGATLRREFLRIVEADDAGPAEFAGRALETG